jgi:nuclear protein localization family protein 4
MLTTLKLSGERPPKRSLDPSSNTASKGAAHRGDQDRLRRQPSHGSDSDSVQLAKRLKGASLKGK